MITHYDLFAGIGGFSLALEEVFDDPVKHIFCEWERFPTAVLKRHWPEGEFWGDIAELVAHTSGQGLERGQRPRNKRPDQGHAVGASGFTIVTGGFPCQPFSAAGRRKGTADDRYQWPNMFEIIRRIQPEWVIAENVRGLVSWNDGLVLETVCSDLEAEDYEVQPFIIPAAAVGAPHRRDRVWILAHRKSERFQRQRLPVLPRQKTAYPDWSRDWREVALATCDASVDDGLPRFVDGLRYSRAKWRRDSIKAYGNGIVPQVAIQIMKAIKEAQYAGA